ncbi:MAG: hypothetical protein AB1Z23_12295 [Eubacteriales bacterium]
MFLIPYDKITFTTNKTKDEILNILAKNSTFCLENWSFMFRDFDLDFISKIGHDSFIISRSWSHRNLSWAIIDGKLREKGEIREVTIKIRMIYLLYLVFTFIFGILISEIVGSIYCHAKYGVYYENTAGFVWAVIIIYFFLIVLFRYSAYEIRERFFELI